MTGRTVQTGSTIGWFVNNEERALPVGVALLDDRLVRGKRTRIPAGSSQAVMTRQEIGDLAGQQHVRGDEDDEVVADPF